MTTDLLRFTRAAQQHPALRADTPFMDPLRTARDLRAATVLVLVLAATVLAATVLPGSSWWSGPVLLLLTSSHGVHLTDLGVVGLGLAVAVTAYRCGLLRSPVLQLPSAPQGPVAGRVAATRTAPAGSWTRPPGVPYAAVATST